MFVEIFELAKKFPRTINAKLKATSMSFFLNEWIILFKAKEDYKTTKHPASSLITLTKQGGLLQKSKEPQTLYNKLHLAREWAAPLASLGTHLKNKKGNLEARGCLVHYFKHIFSVFKQSYTHFHTLFHPHVFPKKLKTV